MIELKNITKIYTTEGNSAIGLNDINLTLPDTGFVCIVGPSGSGKTTLLNVVSCIDSYEEGELIIDGVATSSLSNDELEKFRRNNVGFVYQDYNLIDSYTVLQNVLVPLEISGMPSKEAKQKALELITKVGLKSRLYNRATKLSGGEKQRCSIARALASGAKIISCDEPTGNLDSKTSAEIIAILKDLSNDHLILMVTHNIESIEEHATRIIEIVDAQVASDKIISTSENTSIKSKGIQQVSFRLLLKTAFRNVISTPKRTILTSLIMIILFLVIAVGSSIVITAKDEILYDKEYLQDYNTNYKARNIVTNEKDSIKTINTKGTMVYNDFYFDQVYTCSITTRPNAPEDFMMGYGNVSGKVNGSTIDKCKDNEVFLVLSDLIYSQKDAKTMIGHILEINFYGKFNIAGTKLVSGSNQIFLNDNLKKEFTNTYAELNFNLLIEKSRLNAKSRSVIAKQISDDDENYDIKIPIYLKSVDDLLQIGNEIIDLSLFNVIYTGSLDDKDILTNIYLSMEGLHKLFDIYKPRASIFYNNLNQSKKEFNALRDDYGIINISDFQQSTITSETITKYVLVCVVFIVAVLLVLLATYFILSMVIKFKNKDYNIFRTNGLLKNDLKKVSILELEMATCISLVVVFIILFIMTGITGLGFYLSEMLKTIYLPILIALISFIIVFLLAIKYNRKIFNLTINQSLRVGDLID